MPEENTQRSQDLEPTRFVFTTGCPGSMWSMISHRLKHQFQGFDLSDETAERRYHLPEAHRQENYEVQDEDWAAATHIGSYFGPYHDLGQDFEDLRVYDHRLQDFYRECHRPFSQARKPWKLVKSHWFAYNLPWLWQHCPGHYLFMIWREPEQAERWWYSMGGWDIRHPVYTWYGTPERMSQQIRMENDLIWSFGQQINTRWYDYTGGDEWIEQRFRRPLRNQARARPRIDGSIKVSYTRIGQQGEQP